MAIRKIFLTIGKTVLCGLAFYAGTIAGSILARLIRLPTSSLPAGADSATLGLYMLVTSFVLAATLAFVSGGLAGGFLFRWLILAFLTWIAYGVNTYLEAAIFTTYSAASPSVVIMNLISSLLGAAAVALSFPSATEGDPFWTKARAFFAGRSPVQWAYRFLVALISFPIAYIIFGLLVRPFVIEYYQQQMMGLTAPGWEQILPTLLLRSLLFLSACLPALIAWQKSRFSLFIILGSVLFVLVGGLYMLQSYWYPTTMHVAHGLEILADSFTYAGALVVLLMGSNH